MNSRESKHSPRNCHFIRTVAIVFCVIFLGLFGIKSAHAAYVTNPPGENDIQWKLNDNAATTTVTGSDVNGTLVGGNTNGVATTTNGYPSFYLNGSGQYVSVTIPNIWPSAIATLWAKYSGNPVISAPVFGQLVRNPNGPNGGDWYWFGSYQNNVYRWESSDLIHWNGRTEVLANGGAGAWDAMIHTTLVFQNPNTGTWIMLYRGYNSPTYQIGLATSSDGTTFTRINNGGVNDGLFPEFGSNYDPTGIILVNGTYYVYVNGNPTHGATNVYTSTDFNTFTAYAGNPILPTGVVSTANGDFCSYIWYYGGYYYLLVPHDFNTAGTNLYDHAIGLYRSLSPYFDANSRQFLGYVMVNDQSYDQGYLDTPSIPMTDVYKTTYAPEFGSTLYMIYSGSGSISTQDIASTTFSNLTAREPKISKLFGENLSYSFWIQFKSLTSGESVFSVGKSATSGSPLWLGNIQKNGSYYYLSLFLGGSYRNTSLALATGTPYHVVIAENPNSPGLTSNIGTTTVYINGNAVGAFSQYNSTADTNQSPEYLSIGDGYTGANTLNGYVYDFRIYPEALNATEVSDLYTTGSMAAQVSSIATSTTASTATITWQTDSAASSQVAYGSSPTYTASSTLSSVATTTHSMLLTGLSPLTQYHFAVESDNGTLSTSTDQTLTTAANNDASLSALTVSLGTLSPTFASSTTSYTDVLPHGTVSAPTVTATTDDPNATDTITQASSPTGSATVLVTAEDNITTSTYLVSFTVAPRPVSITSFSLAATSTSLTVPISLAASGTVAGYFVSESPSTPSSTNPGWTGTATTTYTFQEAGTIRTLYAWVKDGSGNISSPASTTVSFPYYAIPATSSVENFVASGIVTSTASNVASTTAITFTYPVEVSISPATVSIPAGTTFTTASSSDFTAITATTSVSTSGIPANSGILGTVQYGFASSSISLNQPVTISIPVDASYDGQSLPVYESENEGVSWTELTTCTVAGGVCSFTTSNLSSFAVVVPTASSTPSTPGVAVATGGGGSAYVISIDNGIATTTTSSVTLSLYGTGAYTMELSNSTSFSSSTWIPYVTTLPWTLASSTGAQTVNVQFRAVSGSIVGSAQASIDLSTAPIPMSAVASTTGMSVSQMVSLLASLKAELHTLEAQVSSQSGFLFTRNLSLWSTGSDVKQLQLFLISQNSGSAAQKLAVHGTTNLFGTLTLNALVEFQKKVGITPASGYFGPKTRAYVNNFAL